MEVAKERNVIIDNVRGIAIFFVVLGHAIEPYMYENFTFYVARICLLCFSMPLTIFVSGFLSKDADKAQKKAFRRFLLPFIVWNSFYCIYLSFIRKEIQFNFISPENVYWYFLSLFTMCLILPIVIRLRWSVLVVFSMSLIIGFFSEFGTLLSLSRTICFLGFFLLGYYCNTETLEKIKRNKILITGLSIITIAIIFVFCRAEVMDKHALAYSLLKWKSYKDIGLSNVDGFLTRAAAIPIAIILGCFALVCIPNKKNIFSVIGRHTIVIYIFHNFFNIILQKIIIGFNININTFTGMLLILIFPVGVTLFLSIDFFHRIYTKFMELVEKIILKENV